MSQIAAEKLVSVGYTNVWNLKGGIMDWEQAGFDIER
jgi:rhodanese-related sulfurtransferase